MGCRAGEGVELADFTEFIELIKAGAGAVDIHDDSGVGYARIKGSAADAFIRSEINRVTQHQNKFVRLLEHFVPPSRRILDVGCCTGGGTLALALSKKLAADLVVGVDPSELSIRAAWARLANYTPAATVKFQVTKANSPTAFEDGYFDLVVSVSVLEFIPRKLDRLRFLQELTRVIKPGGYVLCFHSETITP
jgi:ubiquinone/menaquinone biosynthesis C-methylase UbiE